MLVSEMALFMLLILPLPFTWRRKLFTFISESALVAKLQYGMKVRSLEKFALIDAMLSIGCRSSSSPSSFSSSTASTESIVFRPKALLLVMARAGT